MAKPSPDTTPRLRLLILELWGLGDVALALPFLRRAASVADVTLLAKPHAAPLLRRFAPEVTHVPLTAPWTAFAGKYRLWSWPWGSLRHAMSELRARRFDVGASARPDPRDHVLLAVSGTRRRVGYPRAGSGRLLTDRLARPAKPHRAEHWACLAETLALPALEPAVATSTSRQPGRHVVIHTGAGHAVRRWPRERFAAVADRLRAAGWTVTILDDDTKDIDTLLSTLATADRFIGNDSGPGHLAALLGVPTFTIFGPQLPELFAPQHPRAAWIEGAPCPYKPCFDACRFDEPRCLLAITVADVWDKLAPWIATQSAIHYGTE